jgi:hypothetical protein
MRRDVLGSIGNSGDRPVRRLRKEVSFVQDHSWFYVP